MNTLLVLVGGPFSWLFETLAFYLLFPAALLGILASLIWAIIAVWRRARTLTRPGALFLACVALVGAMFVCECFGRLQVEGNDRRGTIVAQAIQRYYSDNKRYPDNLEQLKPDYVAALPLYWHGVWRFGFHYRLSDDKEPPWLGCSAPMMGTRYYNFESNKWKYTWQP